MKDSHRQLVAILGPTAAGKTSWSLKLAKEFNGEIISADSRQIYREMDIGTGKIKNLKRKHKNYCLKFKNRKIEKLFYDQIEGINHYLINIVNPDEIYTLAQYQEEAIKVIRNIQERGKLPFLVGGTGLYIQAIVDNLQIPSAAPDKALRDELETMSNKKLIIKLKKLDPTASKKIDINNKRRLIRAIEVCQITGRPFSQQTRKGKKMFDVLQIGIKIPRAKLYQRINQRVEEMFTEGLVEEVKKLANKYSFSLPALSGIGYKEVSQYLQNKITLIETKELIKKNTRRYAKRQITWFRKDAKVRWIESYKEAKSKINHFLVS